MGLVQGFSGLVAARWFLGVCESGTYRYIDLLSSHQGSSIDFDSNRLLSSRVVPTHFVL